MRHRMPAASWETIACLIAGVAATLPHTLGLAAAAAALQGFRVETTGRRPPPWQALTAA